METAACWREGFNSIGAVEHVVEAPADDDVLVEGSVWDKLWIGVDGKSKFARVVPLGDRFVEGNPALEGRGADATDCMPIERGGDGLGKADVIDPTIFDLFTRDGGNTGDFRPDFIG